MRAKLARSFPNTSHELSEKRPPEETLELLDLGNLRFSQGLRDVSSFVDVESLDALARLGQHPIATVLTCSDSRLSTETIFNLGLGDLYVLRVAGNVLTDLTLAGIEYSIKSFEVPLVLILGHTGCGAIKTARDRKFGGLKSASKNIAELLDGIECSVENEQNDEVIAFSNVIHQINKISSNSLIIQRLVAQRKLKISGAIYNIETGRVKFI